MNKLGDVVFCVDCDRERQAHLEIAEAALNPDTNPASPETESQNPEQDKHPRRMATKKDANGDPLCSQCLDDRQAKRRAEFMLSDDRRTVVHWPRRGRASDPKPVLLSSSDSTAASVTQGVTNGVTKGVTKDLILGAARSVSLDVTKPANGARSKLAKLPRQELPRQELQKQEPTKNKAAFVRSLPPGTPAKDVIAQAKKQGLEITPAYVYVIRSTTGARKSNGGTQHAAREVRAKSNGRPLNGQTLNHGRGHGLGHGGGPPNARGDARGDGRGDGRGLDIRALRIPKPNDRGIERKFMWLAVELGFLRTEQLLDELRTKIKVVFAH